MTAHSVTHPERRSVGANATESEPGFLPPPVADALWLVVLAAVAFFCVAALGIALFLWAWNRSGSKHMASF